MRMYSPLRTATPFAILLMLSAAQLPVTAQAQENSANSPANSLISTTPSTTDFGKTTEFPDTAGGFGMGRGRGHADGNAASPWDRTMGDAMQMGMRQIGSREGGRPANLESLFEMGSKMSGDLGKALGGDSNAVGRALGTIPKLDQLERNGLKFPVGSSAGKFQFAYHDHLGQGANAMGGGIGRGSAQATYSTNGLKNDMMHFSATAMFGSGGMGQGMGAGMGSSSFSSGTSGASGMFSTGGIGSAGIGSGFGSMGSFSSGGMHGGMGAEAGAMHGMGGGQGGHGKGGSETTPAVSLKLTFK